MLIGLPSVMSIFDNAADELSLSPSLSKTQVFGSRQSGGLADDLGLGPYASSKVWQVEEFGAGYGCFSAYSLVHILKRRPTGLVIFKFFYVNNTVCSF